MFHHPWRLRYLVAALLIMHVMTSVVHEQTRLQHTGRVDYSNNVNVNPKIIGGSNAMAGRFPYYTGLFNQKEGYFDCGGSLIAPDVVLTASHCWGGPYRTWIAQVGRYNLANPNDDFESFDIIKYLPNPFYGINALHSGDFMLLFLNATSSTAPLIKINRDDNVPRPRQNITVIGLGLVVVLDQEVEDDNEEEKEENVLSMPTILQQVTLKALSNLECSRSTDGITTFQGLVTNDSLCVWSREKSYCGGDAGGPLLIQGSSTLGEDLQVGIVSRSRGNNNCTSPIFPNVAARVSQANEWIDKHVCHYSKDPPSWFNCNRPFPPDPNIPTNPVLPGRSFPVTVEIDFDSKPFETWWFLLNSTGHLIYIVPRYSYTLNDTKRHVEQVLYLPVGESYTFVIRDEEGDGISNPGGYSVRLGERTDGEVLLSNYFFDGIEYRTNFTLPNIITPKPTPSPSLSNAPSMSQAPTLPERAVTLTINFASASDSYFFGYKFLNSNNGEVEIDSAPIGSFGFNNITVVTTVYLPKNEEYIFVFMSSAGDLYPGNYTLGLGLPKAGGPVLFFSNGTFDEPSNNGSAPVYEERFNFVLPNSFTAVPSQAPSGHPSLVPTATLRPTAPLQALTLTINFANHNPSTFACLLLDGTNRTVANETFGSFPYFNMAAERIFHVESDQQYTFVVLNVDSDDLYPGNFSIALGKPGDRGPEIASSSETLDESESGMVVASSIFFVPSTFSAVPSMAPTSSTPVTLFIDFAGFPSEIGFSFLNELQEPYIDVPFGSFGFDDSTLQRVYNLPNGYQYIFVISDYYGDGRFPGKFSLVLGAPGSGGKTIVSKTGIVGYQEEYRFSLGGSHLPSSTTPNVGPSPALSASPTFDQTPVSSGVSFATGHPSFVIPVSGTPFPYSAIPTGEFNTNNATPSRRPASVNAPAKRPTKPSPTKRHPSFYTGTHKLETGKGLHKGKKGKATGVGKNVKERSGKKSKKRKQILLDYLG